MEKDKPKKGLTKRKKIILALLGVLLLAFAWFFTPVTERVTIGNLEPLEENQKRLTCVLVTDLHSCRYGKNQKELVDRVLREKPDLIFLCGDIFDDRLSDKAAEEFLSQIAGKASCFYVTGNHEFWSGRAGAMKDYVRSLGITVLEGDCKTVSLKGRTIDICGVDDPCEMGDLRWEEQLKEASEKTSPSHYKVLLSHRPEKTEVYEKYDFDLVLAGHAHAGQFFLPLIDRGMYAPDQGLFARYVNGTYTLKDDTVLLVSRGLARESLLVPRFFNHPEIVVFSI